MTIALVLALLLWALLPGFRDWIWQRRLCNSRVYPYHRPPRLEIQAWAWWLEYYVLTEEFDRQFPGGWSRHDPETWITFRGDDRSRCNAYARKLVAPIKELAPDVARRVLEMPYSAQKRELERMYPILTGVPRLTDMVPSPQIRQRPEEWRLP